MAEAMIITPVVEKSIDFVFTQTYKELQYIWKFKRNLRKISRTLTGLERRREAMTLLIDAAKNNAEVIGPDVEEWLQEVEMIKNEVDEIIHGTRYAQIGCFFNCKCINLKVRYSLSKKAATKTIEIANLQKKGEFSRVGYPAPIGQRPFTSPLEVFAFESRLQVEERVMKALLDENIHVIAVCGMGGVGKTTMVKKIADEIKKDKHFDEIVFTVVSQSYDPINVQQQIAEKLGLEIKETTLDARADRLYTRLMDQGKRILLMIDDLWEETDLCAIGIPSKVDRKGLKVLLTSRLPRVCSKMDVREIVEVGVLTSEEAWSLFKKHANISDENSDDLEGYPRKLADKCQGLPLAVEIIGKTLKDNKNLSDWADALLELENVQENDTSRNEVYSKIAWSVNYLESQRRSVLLLCSLFPEDYEIEVEDLVRYTKGLQLFKGADSMAQTRNRAWAIIHELTDCYLLIACDDHRVKLHDVVRDTCLRIASEGDNVYMVSHSGLTEWPNKDTYEPYTAISLDFDHLSEFSSRLKCCPSLQLLRFSLSGSKIVDIMTSFLQATKRLRVLNINSSSIELPPQSSQTAISLRTLNLHNCSLVGDLSTLLKSLVKVEVLSFYSSDYLGEWPKEIAELSNLKSLDLRFRLGPQEALPTGILIHLKKLEELYLGSVLQLHVPLKKSDECIPEIGSLSKLNTIEVRCYPDTLALLVENLDVERLLRFYISSGFGERSPYEFSRSVILHCINIGMLLKPKMKALLSKIDGYLMLESVTGYTNDLVKDFDGGSVFSRLRRLKLKDCEMKYILDTTNSRSRARVFVELERLYIKGAKHMEELCHGNVPPGSFSRLEEVTLNKVPLLSSLWGPIKLPCLGNLTSLEIHGSEVIRSLFLGSSVKCFARLRFIDITDCPKLETLVSCDGQAEEDTNEDQAEFPGLEEVHLVFLGNTNSKTSVFPKLRILEISGSDHLHVVDVTKCVQNLSSLKMAECNSLETCLDFAGWSKEITRAEVAQKVFHNLDSLKLCDLPNLRHLWRNLPEGTVAFQNLKALTISRCKSLKRLLTPHMAKCLVNLETLDIESCEKLEAIVGQEEMGPSEISVVFQNLIILNISGCGRLRYLLTPSMAEMLVSLKKLVIRDCKELEAIVGLEEKSPSEKVSACKWEKIFDQLEYLELWGLPQLRYFRRMLPEGYVVFQKLLTLNIRRCGGLRYLMTPPMVKMFASLKLLDIYSCSQMESIIGSEDVDEAATNEVVHDEEEILLPELCELKISDLPEFRMLCAQSVDLVLPSWNDFVVNLCPRINRFCAGNLMAPELKQVRFINMQTRTDEVILDLETTRKWFKDCELGKRCINCANYATTGISAIECDHLIESSDRQAALNLR